ncbi:uncharacterized protein LOC102704292 [Oryza brachyantha]|uniref:At1g61320/AtMIF1 LRR domain-containing protein n=1 Tax=Oryza brachyantha TaxID=4533 RepID=J3N8R0_ORYBR|nr:uncharacterized protein LOC102704292 [Oryza brachyantha]
MEPVDQLILSEDILRKIHALMPLEDAARAACSSRIFLDSWRCYPKLVFDMKTLSKEDFSRFNLFTPAKEDRPRDFIDMVDHIMRNHSGAGVKAFILQTERIFNVCSGYLDRWLQVAISPGIKEIELRLPYYNTMDYNFPSSLLSTANGNSIKSFYLSSCAFHSLDKVGCLSSLKIVHLCHVNITGEELSLFLSNSLALKQLILDDCDQISCLKIPFSLSKLKILKVLRCDKLQTIEGNATSLHRLYYSSPLIHISLRDPLKLKLIEISGNGPNMLYYASSKLPFIAPNLKTLLLSSTYEAVNTPMVLGTFLHLKYLEILFYIAERSPEYDFCSLVSFLDASPSLKKFILRVESPLLRHDSILELNHGDSLKRRISEHCHKNLETVMIIGFCSSKTMVELTNHILEYAISLKRLTLDTTCGYHRRFRKFNKCLPLGKDALVLARKSLLAIRTHIEKKIPSNIKFKVIGPCDECHSEEMS